MALPWINPYPDVLPSSDQAMEAELQSADAAVAETSSVGSRWGRACVRAPPVRMLAVTNAAAALVI
jgi:hypothetical protein